MATKLQKRKIYYPNSINPRPRNKTKVNINIYSKKLPKDVLTTDVIDYDFLKVELNPPRRLRNLYYYEYYFAKDYSSVFNKKNKNNNKKNKKNGGNNSSGGKSRNQLCTTKMFYGYNIKDHLKFIKSYMTQENKKEVEDKPKLFNMDNDIASKDDIKEYIKIIDGLHFKFILSPEDPNVPIENLVRSFITQLEKATGYNFSWLAVKHTNTNHPHSHIIINGKDKNGNEVHFDKQMIKETARKIASNICTNLVGYRTQQQIDNSKARSFDAHYFNSHDQKIINVEQRFQQNKIIGNMEYEGEVIARNLNMQKRLITLERIGLAKKINNNIPPIYILCKNWQSALKSSKYYNSFLKARNSLIYTNNCNLEQYTKNTGLVEGIITQRFVMNDEDNWNNAIVIEDKKTGKAYYVPIGFKPDKELIGRVVSCNTLEGKMHPKITVLGNKEKHVNKQESI